MEIEIRDNHLQILKSLKLSGELSEKVSSAVAVVEQSQEKDYATSRFRVDLDDEQIETLVDALGNRLLTAGIDENSEVNAVGREIETLIDVFCCQES